jgi:hypothetical protein
MDNKTISEDNLYRLNLNHPKEVPLDGDNPHDDDDKDHGETPQPAPKQNITETQLIMIVVGCVALLLVILIVGTVLYRQKVSWLIRMERFQSKHQESEPDEIIEDFWELSWDRLIVKTEKIGSGAYGQVFR